MRFIEALPPTVQTKTPIIVDTEMDKDLTNDLSEHSTIFQKNKEIVAVEQLETLISLADSANQLVNSKTFDNNQYIMDRLMMHGCIKNTNCHFQASAKEWSCNVPVKLPGSGWDANGTIKTSAMEDSSVFISVLLESELRHEIDKDPITIALLSPCQPSSS